MKLKFDDKGNVVVEDGKPVYQDDSGKDIVFDYAHTIGTISRLNGEAKTNREARQAAEDRLKAFEGIDDPEAARQALGTVSSLNAGDLRRADEVEKIKAEAKRAYDEQIKSVEKKYEPYVQKAADMEARLNNEIIGGSFSRSKFINEKLAIPADLVQAAFGKAFSLEDGKPVAKDGSGNTIFSRAKPGDIAGFDEALEILVDQYPNRDSILKGSGASGSGAGNAQGSNGGKRTVSRAAFDQMDAATKAATVREATVVD